MSVDVPPIPVPPAHPGTFTEDWSNWVQPRDRNRWKREVRDRWVPWLQQLPVGTMVIGNDAAIWTCIVPGPLNPTMVRPSMWQSGGNVVSDMVLCKIHDDFAVWVER